MIRRFLAFGCAAFIAFTCVFLQVIPQKTVLGSGQASGRSPVITIGLLQFRDLNRNGKLDIYEDPSKNPMERARDVVSQMTLEEKAGAMMHGTLKTGGQMGAVGFGASYDLEANRKLIQENKVNSLITRLQAPPRILAEENNKLQEIAEASRLGIPLTISTDPRHHFQYVLGASSSGTGFSQWPESLGLAAIGSSETTRQFADIARREYRATGIHMALSPQADLATEPRWSRTVGTFGEDADLVGRMVGAYIMGFQNGSNGLNKDSVIAVVKHWVGYGAQADGFDAHNSYGKYSVFPSGNFEYHIRPFLPAFRANVGGVMPTYPIPKDVVLHGQKLEQVGAGFSRQLLGKELRDQYHFGGLIISDWAITNDCTGPCIEGLPAGKPMTPAYIGMPWGVESLSRIERYAKGINAGLDQIGGADDPKPLVDAVKAGLISEARLNESVLRIMLTKFQLGLFDNPYVDPGSADMTVGKAEFTSLGSQAQSRSLVLLENKAGMIPLRRDVKKLFLYKCDPSTARNLGYTVVTRPEDADVAVVRVVAPFETLHPGYFFGLRQHEGDLSFHDGMEDYEAIKSISEKVKTIVTVYLDRPAILTNIRDKATVLIGNFGVTDKALFDALAGRTAMEGRLPFELPSSMDEVRQQAPDKPHDTRSPLYRFGYRLGR